MDSSFLSRRQSLLAALATGPALTSVRALAAAAQRWTEPPAFQRFRLGALEITALCDGVLGIPPSLLTGAPREDISRLLEENFASPDAPYGTAVNVFLINTGRRLLMVDAGSGNLLGPSVGRFPAQLQAAGYSPEDVDVVLMTHLHSDHVGGLVLAGGALAFPKAEVWVSRAEHDAWHDAAAERRAPDGLRALFRAARDSVAPYAAVGRLRIFDAQDALPEGISASAIPGHTPGHTAFPIEDGRESLLLWGDTVHNAAVQFARPEVAIEFDTDQTAAIHSRKQLMAQVAEARQLVAGAHLPFPGIGHVRRSGEAFAWVPLDYAARKVPG